MVQWVVGVDVCCVIIPIMWLLIAHTFIAQQRMAQTIAPHLTDLSDTLQHIMDRIVVVCGDIESSWLGLTRAVWDAVCACVCTVVHSAGAVSLMQPYASLCAANVEGMLCVSVCFILL